ncbi:hypothetical protein HaLaN_16668, partial [Haematococcus lacustris]
MSTTWCCGLTSTRAATHN